MTSPGRARVGCSGWSYPDWRGLVYPAELRARDWFDWYAGHFDTVELNTTFYRLPSLDTAAGWAAQAPPGFCYAVKLGQFGSHRMKLADAPSWLPNHVARLDALGPSAGPTLVQLPPRWRRNCARLDEFLAAFPSDRRVAVELRDPSWIREETFAVLAAHGAALCVHDLFDPRALRPPLRLTADWTYLRFHGPDAADHPYAGRYGGRRLWRLADWLDARRAEGLDVYAYFNNDQQGHAAADAAWLRDRLAPRPGRELSIPAARSSEEQSG